MDLNPFSIETQFQYGSAYYQAGYSLGGQQAQWAVTALQRVQILAPDRTDIARILVAANTQLSNGSPEQQEERRREHERFAAAEAKRQADARAAQQASTKSSNDLYNYQERMRASCRGLSADQWIKAGNITCASYAEGSPGN